MKTKPSQSQNFRFKASILLVWSFFDVTIFDLITAEINFLQWLIFNVCLIILQWKV